MKPKFSTLNDHLVFKKDGFLDSYELPYPESELVNVKAFLADLNRRAEKIANFTADNIKANGHYVFLQNGSANIRVKFPSVKEKHLLVTPDTHEMAKLQAAKSGLPIKDYIRLCLVQCKGDLK